MVDDVPAQVWLLIGIAAVAYTPAAYVFRHLRHDPDRRDITLPREDLGWRSTGRLTISSTALIALAALAIFIFTPQAERFARSQSFMPLLFAAMGLFAAWTVVKGLTSGTIEPLVRGFSRTYERSAHPKRFWASVGWNTLMAMIFLWCALEAISSQDRDRCSNHNDRLSAQEQLASCNDVLAQPDLSREDQNAFHRARGIARHNLGQSERAIDDYTRAIDLDPDDSYALYNRALLYLAGEQYAFAIEDFSQSLKLRPDNKDGYIFRAEAFAQRGDIFRAIADLTTALRLDPDDVRALTSRGIAHVWSDDVASANVDFQRLRSVDPSNIGLLRGKGLLALRTGDTAAALGYLQAAAAREPDDEWTLAALVSVYERLNRPHDALATQQRMDVLRKKRRF